MSQNSAEDALRQLLDGVNNKDPAAIEAACDPEFELTSRFSAVEGKTYRAEAGPSDYLADLEAAWEAINLTIEELIPAGEEKLVVVLHVEAVARGSAVPVHQDSYGAFEFRHGKALRARFYSSRDEALEAVGLRE